MTNHKIKGLSGREVEVIAWLEFYKKYFFYAKDIASFFDNKRTLYRGIQKLLAKKRILKLNQNKYYLVPIKAKSGSWSEHPFIIIDEMCNSKDYFINGWASAHYWHLTDQVPMAYEVFSTNKQGSKTVLDTKILFHRIRKIDPSKVVMKTIAGHSFFIMNKQHSTKWINSRE